MSRIVVAVLVLAITALLFCAIGRASVLDDCPQEDSCGYVDGRWRPVDH